MFCEDLFPMDRSQGGVKEMLKWQARVLCENETPILADF
jgi:hypothetical protein